ncbi:hypothetical protein ABZ468_26000 [Streptomyces sp. NPDC005708]|uniref:hypothetical protein n=1 Tax=Streptomyces sp. NPDC005708 TaxID=3154564 RepID=UPI0033F59A30
MAESGPWPHEEGHDTWSTRQGLAGQAAVGRSCSFCGSLHPDRFMELVREGWIVGPTDKDYKAYLERPGGGVEAKFYFQHLSEAQCREFVDLYNSRAMSLGFPGRFYRMPFFMERVTAGEQSGERA